MNLYYADHFVLPLPEGHRFPMSKYQLLRERIVATGMVAAKDLHVPQAASDDQLRLVHTPDYLDRMCSGQLERSEIRRIGFPWTSEMVERSRRSVGATIHAASDALTDGVAVNLAGGTHHAFADAGEGYCVFNDVAVAARVLQQQGRIRRALVVDCDVHQGNGTAAIFASDSTVFTFSMHSAKNFPLRKHTSDRDIALEDGVTDDEYLSNLQAALPQIMAAAEADLVFYLAGADPFEGDKLGRLKLTKAGLAARDALVFSACRERSLPVAVAMAGGYAQQVEDIVDIHAETVRQAAHAL